MKDLRNLVTLDSTNIGEIFPFTCEFNFLSAE